jgi:hypothetical protein
MAKEPIDRRFKDIAAHEAIIGKLTENNNRLIVIDERQQVVLKRLDQINGTVADYNSNKQKFDAACQKVETLEVNIVKAHEVLTEKVVANEALIMQKELEHEKDLKELDDRYIGKRLFTTLSVILGLMITVATIIQIIFAR